MPLAAEAVDSLYRTDWGRIVATLIRLVGDFTLAEDAAQEAFAAALVTVARGRRSRLATRLDHPDGPAQGHRPHSPATGALREIVERDAPDWQFRAGAIRLRRPRRSRTIGCG